MRFYNLSELEYYNSNPVFGCYKEPVFIPYDIRLQIPRLPAISSYTLTINVCDESGTVLEDASANFDSFLGSFIVSGVTYYYINIRLDTWSTEMTSNNCFLLQAIVESGGTEIFNKYTQLYTIAGSTSVYVPVVYLNDKPLVECVPAPDQNNCNRNYAKFSCYFDCIDNYTGEYYGESEALTGVGTYPFRYERYCYIEGVLRELPTEIKRTISINCRTQKTQWTPQLTFFGTGESAFPIWKVRDVETMMLANHLYVNDTEYQSEGGTIFERYGSQAFNNQARYKMTMPLQECYDYQIFGCVATCEDMAGYYMFPREFSLLYNERKEPIAQNMDELEIYLETQIGYKSSAQLPFVLPCPVFGLLKVESSGQIPPFIYVNEPVPVNRIYPVMLASGTSDLSALCNGVTNNNQIPEAEVTGYDSETIQVPQAEVTGYESQDANEYIIAFTVNVDWTLENATTSAVNYQGTVNLSISISTTAYTEPFTNANIGSVSQQAWPNQTIVIYGDDNPNMLPGSTLTIQSNGVVLYSGDATSVSGNNYYLELYNIEYNINN